MEVLLVALVLFLVLSPSFALDDPIQMDYGEITLEVTNQFEPVWNSDNTWATAQGAFWNPVSAARNTASSPVRPLGHLLTNSFATPNQAALLVRPSKSANPTQPPLADPVGWNLIYYPQTSDYNRKNLYLNNVWEPVPPAGYVAMGLIVTNATGQDIIKEPPLTCIYTVRRDLTAYGSGGAEIWSNRNMYAESASPVSFYSIDTPHFAGSPAEDRAKLAPGTFFMNKGYKKPVLSNIVNVLWLTMAPVGGEYTYPQPPALTSIQQPAHTTPATGGRAVTVPMTAVNDADRTLTQQIETTPFYTFTRTSIYALQNYFLNTGLHSVRLDKTIEYGTTSDQSHGFSVKTGMSYGVSFGGTIGLFTAKVSTTLTASLGYSRTTGIVETKTTKITTSVSVAPGTAAAIWTIQDTLQLVRLDGTQVGSVSYNSDIVALQDTLQLVRLDGTQVGSVSYNSDIVALQVGQYPPPAPTPPASVSSSLQ